MEDLIRFIVQALVDNPGQVSVSEVNGKRTAVFELRVAKTDLGKVIGKQGRNIQSIRTLLSAISAKTRKYAVLEIVE
jgi:uncharacterized protein